MIYTHTSEFLSVLIEREVMWLRKYIALYNDRKYTVFAAGPYGRRFFNWLANDYGIVAEFFIDNNSELNGQTACGKTILQNPWETMSEFCNNFFVLISTKDTYYHEIARQLDEVGVPYLSSDAFSVVYYWERCKTVVNYFNDDLSKISYLAVLWYWLTYDDRFVQTMNEQYFAVKAFSNPIGEIIIDAGAFVGDTVEEYLKKSVGDCTIYAFEPDKKLVNALETRKNRLLAEWALSDNAITIIPAGLGDKTRIVSFTQTGKKDAHIATSGETGTQIKIHALDDFFIDKHPPTLIKADIEGSELGMLMGAVKLIKNTKPKLAICIYHSLHDLVKIPEYIYNLNSEYQMSVRNHSGNYNETVLYCY